MDSIALKIQRRRTELGITQSELARRCGLPPVTIWNIEKGARGAGLKSVVLIARALGLCVDWLVREDDFIANNETRELLHSIKDLSPRKRKKVEAYIKSLSAKKNRNKTRV